MELRIESEHLNGIRVIIPEIFKDHRGFLMESYRSDKYQPLGLSETFVQDIHSGSVKNVFRGLHFQYNPPMGKLIRVTSGSIILYELDIRKNSPTLGKWVALEVTAQNRKQVWAPAGFANGFFVLSGFAEVQYKCTAIFNKTGEGSIRWNDPDIGLKLPVKNPIMSEKDKSAMTLKQWLAKPESCFFAL